MVTVSQSFIGDIGDCTQAIGDAGDAVYWLVGAVALVDFKFVVLEGDIVCDGVGVVVKEDMAVVFFVVDIAFVIANGLIKCLYCGIPFAGANVTIAG